MYPIALHLQGKKCIVFGAGKVAQRRVWGLLESGAEVTVAAPEPMPACWKNAKLPWNRRWKSYWSMTCMAKLGLQI